MATLGSGLRTYRDIVTGLKADGSRDADIVELLAEENPILDDLMVQEANDGTGNKSVIRAGLPTMAWLKLYQGVSPSKGTKKEVRDASGHGESLMEVAKRLWKIAPDREQFMLDEAKTHIQAMGQGVASKLIYGNIATDPDAFNGLTMRFTEHGSTDEELAAHYVISATSTQSAAALRSIWLVGHGSQSVFGFYPKGVTGGLIANPVEEDWAFDSNDGRYKVLLQQFEWDIGVTVKDFRYVGRLSNIESDEMFDTTGVGDYVEMLRRLKTRVKSDGVQQCFYMPPDVFEMIEVVCHRKTQGNAIKTEDIFGRKVETIWGIPVRTLDCMAVNEDITTSV